MDENREGRVESERVSVNISGEKGEKVEVGPGGIHLVDGDSEVDVSWSGIRIREGRKKFNILFWKPLLGCGAAIIIFFALLTAVIVGVVRLMTR